MGSGVENGVTNLPQSVAKLTATIATKDRKQLQSRIQQIVGRYGATARHRNSSRDDFEATRKVSVTDCDGHIYIYTYIQTLGDLGVKISCLTFWLGNKRAHTSLCLYYATD